MAAPISAAGKSLTVMPRVAICFAAAVIGALGSVLFSHILFAVDQETEHP